MSVKVTLHPTNATKVHNVFGIAMLWKLFLGFVPLIIKELITLQPCIIKNQERYGRKKEEWKTEKEK